MKTVRILVTGSRNWTAKRVVWEALNYYSDFLMKMHVGSHVVVVHGDCPTGADAIAQDWCDFYDNPVERHPADWKHGKAAGPRRNGEMVDLGADICLAFPLPDSRGTVDCMRKANEAGIPIIIFNPED